MRYSVVMSEAQTAAADPSDRHLEVFAEHRRVLVGAAYRILGSLADADDVVQETWLRWSRVDLADVREHRAYLLRITSRLALNRLREQRRRREQYVGPWLPEPVADLSAVGADASVELAESVSMAMLVVLETLSPLERAAFVLREVFEVPFAEIAESLDRTEAAVRQLVHRARAHVRERTPRHTVDPDTHRAVTTQFLESVQSGAIEAVVRLMAPDVELISDGGGKRRAALQPIHGADKILRFLAGVMARPDTPTGDVRITDVNGLPAVVLLADGEVDTVGMVELADGLVRRMYVIRNPDKLTRIVPGS